MSLTFPLFNNLVTYKTLKYPKTFYSTEVGRSKKEQFYYA